MTDFSEEIIRIFNAKEDEILNKHLQYPNEMSDPDEIRFYQGFRDKQKICYPFFSSLDDFNDFFEIVTYRNIDGEAICEFWNSNGELFKFYCYNHQDEFNVISQFINLAKNMCQIEESMAKIINNENSKEF